MELDEIKDNNINNFNENEDELSDNSLKGEENNLKIINSDIENSDEYFNDFSKSYIEDSEQSNPDEMIDDIKIPNLFERLLMDNKNLREKELIQ